MCTALELCRDAGSHFSKLPVRSRHRKIIEEDEYRLGAERKCRRAERVNDGFEGGGLALCVMTERSFSGA